ncbi:MAG: LPXTG cell wall anchor domain-containing protein [Chloroflexi bacterium]|nr:LPXTG cell wall anchor domain-containing protein [Chloroflexota bacterium]
MSWSGTAVWQMVTFYNSLYFIMGLATLLLVGVWLLWRRKQQAVALLYFAVPFLFLFIVVIRVPTFIRFPRRCHFGGGVGTAIWQKVSHQSQLKWAAAALFALFWLVSAAYVYLMFIDTTPERQRTWAENRPAFYPTTWAEPPLYGVFGFPHQAGWRIVRPLLKEDAFPYASNEEREVTNWYMVHAPRTHCPNFGDVYVGGGYQRRNPVRPGLVGIFKCAGRGGGKRPFFPANL